MRYRERLTVPISWWVLAAVFETVVAVAVGSYLGTAGAVVVVGLVLLIIAAIFWSAATVLTVTGEELTVGRARIELDYVADCRPLDAEATRRRTGPQADARAYLLLRPYVPTAVEVTLNDPEDPVPYWLVSTRHPAELAAAVGSGLPTRLAE